MTAKGLLSRVQPAEWPLLGFVAYALVRAAAAGSLPLSTKSIPPFDLLIPFLTVVTFRLVLQYREIPWRPDFEHRRILHNIMFYVFMSVGALCLVYLRPPENNAGGTVAPILMKIDAWFSSLLICVVAPLFAWVIYGLHIKKHGGFKPSFFKESKDRIGADVRAWFPPLALIYSYGLMARILARPLFPDRDPELWAIDKAIFFGHDPHAWVESIISGPLSEWLAAAYISYTFLYPLALGVIYAKRDPRPFREVAFATTFALAVGYVFYTLVPAQGPVFTQHHDVSLDFYYLGFVKDQLMDRTRIPRDCFPSLHTCMSLIFLYYSWKHARWLAYVFTPFVLSIPFSCVYLRYHYVIDVLAGIVLFVVTVLVERKIFAGFQLPAAPPEEPAVAEAVPGP